MYFVIPSDSMEDKSVWNPQLHLTKITRQAHTQGRGGGGREGVVLGGFIYPLCLWLQIFYFIYFFSRSCLTERSTMYENAPIYSVSGKLTQLFEERKKMCWSPPSPPPRLFSGLARHHGLYNKL